MKHKIPLLAGLFLVLSCSFLSCNQNKNKEPVPKDSLALYSDPELTPLINTWAGVYGKLNPEVKIHVNDMADPVMLENAGVGYALGFFKMENDRLLDNWSHWKEVVGREVIVPVISSTNPDADRLNTAGITPEFLAFAFAGKEDLSWAQMVPAGRDVPVNVVILDDASVLATLAMFTGSEPSEIRATRVKHREDLMAALKADAGAVGICRLSDVIDASGQSIIADVQLLPFDLNGNRNLDFKESIYSDLNTFSRGVWIGKYPRALVSNIYSVSALQPAGEEEVAFLKWILSNGQLLLGNHGYSDLVPSERVAKARIIDKFITVPAETSQAAVPKAPLFTNIYFLAALVFLAIILFLTIAGFLSRERENTGDTEGFFTPKLLFNEEFIRNPYGLYYDKSHTWAFMNEEGLVKIGIDDFLQHVTGTLTNIKLKSPGERIRKGKHVFSVIQDGKQLDICTPVSGTIQEVNPLLKAQASLLNKEPYRNGWVYKIEPTQWIKEIKFMILGNKCKEWFQGEINRLKEFFANSLRPETARYANILQDGGELSDGLLKDFGPVIWEDFQTHFLDT